MRARPLVSVVVPCYNYGRYLPDAVGSALGQPDVDVEVVIVDDASTDDSAGVADELAAHDARVRFIRHPVNAGHIATYNDGLAAATGDYLVLLSADDLLSPGSLARATGLLEAHDSVGLTYGRVERFSTAQPPPSRSSGGAHWKVWRGIDWLGIRAVKGRNCIYCPEVVMRATTYQKVGPYRSDLPHSADFAMWLAAAGVADIGYVKGVDQAYYRFHGDNMHASVFQTDKPSGMIVDLEHRRMAFQTSLADVAGGELLYQTACRALAREALWHACGAFDRGTTAVESPSSYLEFATAADPHVQSTSPWRALDKRIQMGPAKAAKRPARYARIAIDDVAGRIRWQQWRRTGL